MGLFLLSDGASWKLELSMLLAPFILGQFQMQLFSNKNILLILKIASQKLKFSLRILLADNF